MNRSTKRKVLKTLFVPIKAILALIITFGLFFSFSVLNSLFHGATILKKKDDRSGPRVLMERITPPPPEPVKAEVQKMRTVAEQSSHSSNSSGSGGDSRFMPDLSLGGGGDGIAVAAGGSGFSDGIYEDGQTDERPIAVSRTPLVFPEAAKRARIEGTVEVVFVVNREGRVQDIQFTQVPHKMFEQPIRSTILSWRFKPAMLKGVPVAVRVRQRVDFNLRDNE